MQRLEFRAMGSAMLAALDADGPRAAAGIARAPSWFAAWERCLSRFQAESELSRLNRDAGRPVRVSGTLFQVLQVARQAARWSDGLVSPTVLRALEAAGYDRSFERLAAGTVAFGQEVDGELTASEAGGDGAAARGPVSLPPNPRHPKNRPQRSGTTPADGHWKRLDRLAVPACDWRAIACVRGGRTVTLPAGVALDLGGIVKGWAADRAARRLSKHGPALVDAGGDIAVSGPMADGQPWLVGVADPRDPEGQIALLTLRAGGIATSGRDFRRWRHGRRWQHHIIDPRSGRPAATDVLSATVIAPTACAAEVAAKTAFILGSGDGLAWLEQQPALAGLLVLEDGHIARSRRLEAHLWR